MENLPASNEPVSAVQENQPPTPPEKKPASVARSAGIVSLAVMASRILGLVREVVFAKLFGASASYANDAYVIAFRIPNLLRDLFAEGALSSAFVTVFAEAFARQGRERAFQIANRVLTG